MGQPKAWLRYNGRYLLDHIIQIASQAGVQRVICLVGSQIKTDDGRGVYDDVQQRITIPKDGQWSCRLGKCDGHLIDTIRLGLEHHPKNHALLLWPVDQPCGPIGEDSW